MPNQVYAAVYSAFGWEASAPPGLATDFIRAAHLPGSHLDSGDDPAFYSAMRLGGPVSWGVCRPPLRRRLRAGDVVAFFAARKLTAGLEYSFKGFATVRAKVSQVEIWERRDLQVFRQYLNLLIRPGSKEQGGYEWYEPVARHPDWLWRICQPNGHLKREFDELSRQRVFRPGQTSFRDGTLVSCSASYVLFSCEPVETYFLAQPVPVACAPPLGEAQVEKWSTDKTSQAIAQLVLRRSSASSGGGRGLKTKNLQRAHSHLVLDLVADVDGWRREALDVLRK